MISVKRMIFFILVIFASCLTSDSREEKILKHSQDKDNIDKYQIYLVNPENYTTKGAEYHARYYQYLIGIARTIHEEKKISMVERSIGFYYDKREDKKNKLYLGIDIDVPLNASLQSSAYDAIAISQLRKYLGDVLYVLQSCTTVFKEKEVVGSVIGIKWEHDGLNEMVSVWVDKQDVISYEKKALTFDEIIQRNFVTNTEGKIIRLLR